MNENIIFTYKTRNTYNTFFFSYGIEHDSTIMDIESNFLNTEKLLQLDTKAIQVLRKFQLERCFL